MSEPEARGPEDTNLGLARQHALHGLAHCGSTASGLALLATTVCRWSLITSVI